MTQLEQIKQKIDNALEARAESQKLISEKIDKLKEIKEQIASIQSKIDKSNFENKSIYLSKLNDIDFKIKSILESAKPIEERFNRKTINIGVAGITHAGKSTLYRALSGLTPNEIPTEDNIGAGQSTTATKSVIINSDHKEFIVYYRTEEEFREFLKTYLPEKHRSLITSSNSFMNLDLNQIEVELGSETSNLDRLKEVQASMKTYNIHKKLNSEPEKIDFDQIQNYVSYNKGDDPARYWAITKLAEIKCPFTSLDSNSEIKLSLVDLPGTRERESVTEQTGKDLDKDVDSVLIMYRTDETKDADINEVFEFVNRSQKNIIDRDKFIAFYINEFKGDTKLDGHKKTIKRNIDKYFGSKREWQIFETPIVTQVEPNEVLNTEQTQKDFIDLLDWVGKNISYLDKATFDSWFSKINLDEEKKSLNELVAKISTEVPFSEDEEEEMIKKVEKLKKSLASNFNKLRDSYAVEIKTVEIAKRIISDGKTIWNRINNNLLDDPNWEENRIKQTEVEGGDKNYSSECSRLWTYLRREYQAIEVGANELLDNLVNEIINLFNKTLECPNFITKKGTEGVKEFLEKVENSGVEIPYFTDAFKSICSEKISFHQVAYQFIISNNVHKILDTKTENGGEAIFEDALPGEDSIKKTKTRLEELVRIANEQFFKILTNNCPSVISAFLYSKIEYFNDCINRTSFDTNKTIIFRRFLKAFRFENEDTQTNSDMIEISRDIVLKIKGIINNIEIL